MFHRTDTFASSRSDAMFEDRAYYKKAPQPHPHCAGRPLGDHGGANQEDHIIIIGAAVGGLGYLGNFGWSVVVQSYLYIYFIGGEVPHHYHYYHHRHRQSHLHVFLIYWWIFDDR